MLHQLIRGEYRICLVIRAREIREQSRYKIKNLVGLMAAGARPSTKNIHKRLNPLFEGISFLSSTEKTVYPKETWILINMEARILLVSSSKRIGAISTAVTNCLNNTDKVQVLKGKGGVGRRRRERL